jgi:MFS family permease
LRPNLRELELNAGTLLFFLATHSVAPYISRYAITLGAGEGEVALLGPTLSLMALVLRPLSGYLVDAGLLRPLLLSGVFSAMVAQVVYASSSSVAVLYLGRVLQGIGIALFIPASIYSATLVGSERGASEALAWRATMIGLSMALGPAVGGVLVGLYGYGSLFTTALAYLSASLVLNALASRGLRPPTSRGGGRVGGILRVSFLVPLVAVFGYSALYSSLSLFLPALHESLGVDVAVTSLVFTSYSLANLAARLVFTQISGRVKPLATATAGYALALLGIYAVTSTPASQVTPLLAAVAGFGAGLLIPSLQIAAILSVEPESRGLASGVYTAMFDVGNLVGPPLAITLGTTYSKALGIAVELGSVGLLVLAIYSLRNFAKVAQPLG